MENLFQIFYLFLCYSFLGWILEVVYSAIRKRKFINRGYPNPRFINLRLRIAE